MTDIPERPLVWDFNEWSCVWKGIPMRRCGKQTSVEVGPPSWAVVGKKGSNTNERFCASIYDKNGGKLRGRHLAFLYRSGACMVLENSGNLLKFSRCLSPLVWIHRHEAGNTEARARLLGDGDDGERRGLRHGGLRGPPLGHGGGAVGPRGWRRLGGSHEGAGRGQSCGGGQMEKKEEIYRNARGRGELKMDCVKERRE